MILIRGIVIKIPSFYSWRNFLRGLISNLNEQEFWKAFKSSKMCPVLFCFPLGLFLIMPKASPLTYEIDFESFLKEPDFHIPAEPKPDSFGIYNGRIVVIDYGD